MEKDFEHTRIPGDNNPCDDDTDSIREQFLAGSLDNKPSYESICSQLLRANQRIKELESQPDPRIEGLVEALMELIRCAAVFKDNLLSPDVTLQEYMNAVDKAKQALQPGMFTINNDH